MLLFAVLSVSIIAGIGDGRGVLSALRWVGRELFSVFGVGEGCGVVSTLR